MEVAFTITSKLLFTKNILKSTQTFVEFTIIKSFNNYKRIGTTLDDALGEAFDKSARVLGLKYIKASPS